MKRYLLLSLLALGACNSGNTDSKKGEEKLPATLVNNPHTADGMDATAAAEKPIMSFRDTVHDFGTIHENEQVQHDFEFTNTGKSPLLITGAAGSCGCTVPEYPHEPIPPGKTGILKVTFNSAGKQGHQEKSVTVNTNTLRSTELLFIKAEVLKK